MRKIKEFIFLNLADYEGIAIPFPIGAVLLCVVVSMIAFMFIYNYRRSHVITLYKRLIRFDAISDESAMTLCDLYLDSSRVIRTALSGSGEITSIVKRVGEAKMSYEEYVAATKKKGYKPEKIDFSEAKFYISPDVLGRAKGIVAKSEPSIWKPIIFSVVLIGVLVLAIFFLPDLLSAISRALE